MPRGGIISQADVLSHIVNRMFPCGDLSLDEWKHSLVEWEKSLEEDRRKKAIDAWRSRMSKDQRAMFKWVCLETNSQTFNLFHKDNRKKFLLISLKPSLCCVIFGKAYGTDLRHDLDTMCQEWDNATFSVHAIENSWSTITTADLTKVIPKLSHTSAGLDGWSGAELDAFSIEMIQELSRFYQFMETCGTCPSMWTKIRQTHIPKSKGFRPEDQACDVAALRPISVTSVFWRLWTSSRLKKPEVTDWIKTWTPRFMHAGSRGRGCHTALHDIVKSVENLEYLASLNFSTAFDRTHAVLAVHAFRKMGLPQGIASILQNMWCAQDRYFQLLGHTHIEPVSVNNALLQGDPWSMVALNACLLAPFMDVNTLPQATQSLYVDDSTITCPSAETLQQAVRAWQVWSDKLALKENPAKQQT